MYHLFVYVPQSHTESVKKALFDKGAGRYHHYDCCCWQTTGTGQFRPLEKSNPFIGTSNEIASVCEVKLEMIVEDRYLHDVITALKEHHPYEEPAFGIVKLTDIETHLTGNT